MQQYLLEAYQWYLVHRTPFELLGLLLAVVGTMFAVMSIKDGRKLTRDLAPERVHLRVKRNGHDGPASVARSRREASPSGGQSGRCESALSCAPCRRGVAVRASAG